MCSFYFLCTTKLQQLSRSRRKMCMHIKNFCLRDQCHVINFLFLFLLGPDTTQRSFSTLTALLNLTCFCCRTCLNIFNIQCPLYDKYERVEWKFSLSGTYWESFLTWLCTHKQTMWAVLINRWGDGSKPKWAAVNSSNLSLVHYFYNVSSSFNWVICYDAAKIICVQRH